MMEVNVSSEINQKWQVGRQANKQAGKQATFLQIAGSIHDKAPLVNTAQMIAIWIIGSRFDFFLTSFFLKQKNELVGGKLW